MTRLSAWTQRCHGVGGACKAIPGKRWPLTVDRDGALLIPPATAVARPAIHGDATGPHAIGRPARNPPAIPLLLLAADVTRPEPATRPIATSSAAWLLRAVIIVPTTARRCNPRAILCMNDYQHCKMCAPVAPGAHRGRPTLCTSSKSATMVAAHMCVRAMSAQRAMLPRGRSFCWHRAAIGASASRALMDPRPTLLMSFACCSHLSMPPAEFYVQLVLL